MSVSRSFCLAFSRLKGIQLLTLLLVVHFLYLPPNVVLGQYQGAPSYGAPASGGLPSSVGGTPVSGVNSGASSGGAAMADFDTLMNLIQQTIEPDSWLVNGGTNTILPYPSGVYVDPVGHLKRIREPSSLTTDLASTDLASTDLSEIGTPRHPWREESEMRVVSLKRLDRAIQAWTVHGLNPSLEVQKLAGLSKIKYVKIDAASEDILIAGPASDSVHGFELQDLAVLAALVCSDTQPLGCSIDPSDDGIRAAQAMLKEDGVLRKLARNPRMVVEELQQRIGPHNVTVFGMPANTGTAVALVDADEHMKKLGFGTVQTAVPISSYFDHLDRQGSPPPTQSLIRWWFAFSDETIRVGPSGNLFELPENCLAVMSEQQWVTQQGRAPTGANDAAADAFAKGITDRLPALRVNHDSYARINAVFELSLALQLASERTGLPNLKAWLPNLCTMGQSRVVHREGYVSQSAENPVPRTVEGLMTWHKLKSNGSIVAVVSGGVKIDALQVARQDQWEQSKFLSSSVVPERPTRVSAAHGRWWWEFSN